MKLGTIAKRAVWILAALVVVLAGLALTGHKTVHTEIVIPAPPNEVWSVLTNAPRYSEWNPVLVRVEGDYAEGAELVNHVRNDRGQETVMRSTVVKLAPERELNQRGGVRGLLTFDHTWLLEPVAGGTKVVQREEYRGLGVWFWDPSGFEAAYARANKALRDHVLKLQGTK